MNENLVHHLIEIRKRIIYILIGFLIAFAALFFVKNELFNLVSLPLLKYLPSGTKLIATDVTAPFFVPLKLNAIAAIFISLPNTIFQIWQFIAPGLYNHEQRLAFFVTTFAIVLFCIGVLFCYFLVLPILFNFINQIKSPEITMFTDINKYLDFILNMFVIFGLSFQTPIVIFFLIYFNIATIANVKKARPYAFIGCFVVAAIVTPPDVFSQSLLAISLYILYELGLILTKILSKPRSQSNA